jgi:DNA-binding response OmpR family regulator
MADSTGPARVLVADSDEDALRLTARHLERAGYQVLVARNGEEALTLARSARPDVCVLDVITPKLTGYDVIRMLREDPRTGTIAVILLTALATEAAAMSGLGTGADGYVRKPFSTHELRDCVQEVLARRGGEPARPSAACTPPAAA